MRYNWLLIFFIRLFPNALFFWVTVDSDYLLFFSSVGLFLSHSFIVQINAVVWPDHLKIFILIFQDVSGRHYVHFSNFQNILSSYFSVNLMSK
jgi:hypothetical protein